MIDLKQLHPTWREHIQSQLELPYMNQLLSQIARERQSGKVIFPEAKQVFRAFQGSFGPGGVKVVLLGQDPYHGEAQAEGLSFSVAPPSKIPPSLRNIFKELKNNIEGFTIPANGSLEKWVAEGVLLLNTILTVEAGRPGSHAKYGWEIFTDSVIQCLNNNNVPKVFLLWGAHAEKKKNYITNPKHLVLNSSHPSPLSAYRGFLGCGHFSKANGFLKKNKREIVDWRLQ